MLALFAWLKVGIQTDHFQIGQYKIDGLYIKLDKKFILKAEKVNIPQSKRKISLSNIDKIFDRTKYLFTYFDYIELKNINFKDNTLNFFFVDDILYIKSDDYELAGNIERRGKLLVADISMLYLKKEKINIQGKLKYFLNKDRMETEGSFSAYNIKGNFAAFKDYHTISFAVKSDPFSDLKTLTAKFPLKEEVKSWIAEKIVAKEYLLHSLVGKAYIKDKKINIDLKKLRGDATLKHVKIHFQNGLDPVLAKSVKLHYADRALYFDLKDPTYKGRDLNGSKVSIKPLRKGKIARLYLDLHVESQVDRVVQKILKSYKLTIPVLQKGKMLNADINLSIPLKKQYKSEKEKKRHPVHARVTVSLAKGTVSVGGLKLPVQKGKVLFDKDVVVLKNVQLKDPLYETLVNGKIFVKKKRAELKLKVLRAELKAKGTAYLRFKDKALSLSIDYARHIIKIPELKTEISYLPKDYTIILQDIAKIKPYLQNVNILIDGGKLNIKTKDFAHYTFSGVLKRFSCFLYDKNNVCHTQIPCEGTVSANSFLFIAFNKRLKIDFVKNEIMVNRLNIDLKAFFASNKAQSKMKKNNRSKNMDIVVRGRQSKLRYETYTLLSDSYKITSHRNGNIDAVARLNKDKVLFQKRGRQIKIDAIRVKDELLHPLINFNGLKHGRYSFKFRGDPDKTIYGEIRIEGGVMSDFKAYNNSLAFINTLPALATLNKPGFSQKGFTIKHGIAKFRKIGDKIIFDSINIEGSSANIVGRGEIDLKKDTININLAILTARELGKAIGSVPVLGYILMGEDKSMTVGLKISGSLSKPVVETSATKELLKLPLDIIKRTFESPGKLIDTQKKRVQKPKKEGQTEVPDLKPLLEEEEIQKRKKFNQVAP